MVLYPIGLALWSIALVALSFIVQGALNAVIAAWLRPAPRWWLGPVCAIPGLVAGVLMLHGWPTIDSRHLGILFGANLVLSGMFFLVLVFDVRRQRSRS